MLQWLVHIIQGGAVVSAVLMVLVILLQEPKSGALAMLHGTRLDRSLGVANPLRRATVYLAIFFLAGSLMLAMYH